MLTFEQQQEALVADAARFMDADTPGWFKLIDVNTLALGGCKSCIAGQTTRLRAPGAEGSNYLRILTAFERTGKNGAPFFDTLLKPYWINEIEARLAASP